MTAAHDAWLIAGHLALLRSRNIGQVSDAVKRRAAHAVPTALQGGHTGLVGTAASDPNGTELIHNSERLNKVRSINAPTGNVVVDAGCIFLEARADASVLSDLYGLLKRAIQAITGCSSALARSPHSAW